MGTYIDKRPGAFVHDDGVDFCVWAPFAKEVAVLLTVEFDSIEIPMTVDKDGYWHVKDTDAKPGQTYKFKITSEQGEVLERNDPYAKQLTDSDNGLSVIVDYSFDWGEHGTFKPAPKETSIIYELHIGTFNKPDASTIGTFASAIEKLDYLVDLGVTHIELMPVTSMAKSHGWGYAPNYIFSVENSYGGRRGLLEFVKACHEKGIGVILDVVYNHFFKETDLWQYDGWNENDRGGIYFYNDIRGDTPWGGRPDYGRPEVRQFLLDNVAMWFTDFRMDGLRVDSTIFMRTTNGDNNNPDEAIPDAWTLLSEMTSLARKINPNALLIAEDNSTKPELVASSEENGAGFDAQWEVGFPNVLRQALGVTGAEGQQRLEGVIYELAHTYTGRATDRIIFSDSHDTAANGSARLNEVVTNGNAGASLGRKAELLANGITLTAPGIPMLLQGAEFNQKGTFNDWQMLEWEHTEQFAGIVEAHRHLLALRRDMYENAKGLTSSNVDVYHQDSDNTVIAYRRWENGGVNDDIVVIANFSDARLDNYQLPMPSHGEWSVRFNSSWKGYSPEFSETTVPHMLVDTHQTITVDLSDYNLLILGKTKELE